MEALDVDLWGFGIGDGGVLGLGWPSWAERGGVQCGPRGTGLFAVAAAVFDVGALALASEPRFGGAAEHEEGQPR